MRKPSRFLAFFLCFVLLFLFMPVANIKVNGSDAKFKDYYNMDDNAVANNFQIPNLFRQDGVYSNISKFPLVVSGGVEFVPVSMFILYPYVDVNYSKTSDSFFLINTRNNHYITFNVAEGVASTHDGTLLQVSTRIFNKTRYLPAREVASVLGFVCESYDNTQKGVYAFRISDGKSTKSLNELILPYIEEYLPDTPILPDPEIPIYTPEPPPIEVAPQQDPLEEMASRRVLLCYSGIGNKDAPKLLETLDRNRIPAAFALSKNDIVQNHTTVRELFVKNHTLAVTASVSGDTPGQIAHSFVTGLDEANEALEFVIKRKTRICLLPFDLPAETAQSEEFLSVIKDAGYVIFSPNVDTGDGPEYTGSAYSVSGKIKNKITSGFDEKVDAVILASLYISDKSIYYTVDVAQLVNKYGQFSFNAVNESYLTHN